MKSIELRGDNIMSKNTEAFKKFIQENKIPMAINTNIEGFTAFNIPEDQALSSGAKVKVTVVITNDDTYADMYIYNIATVEDNESIKNNLYKLLNDLNSTYKFISFYEVDNIINAKSSIPFSDNFHAKLVFDILAVLFKAVDNEYSKIIDTIK